MSESTFSITTKMGRQYLGTVISTSLNLIPVVNYRGHIC